MIKLNYNKETETASLEIEGTFENIVEELLNATLDILEEFAKMADGEDPLLNYIQLLVDYKNETNKKGVVM